MVYGNGDTSTALGFAVVTAISQNGGNDSATITTTTGRDRIYYSPERTSLGPVNRILTPNCPRFRVQGFASVHLQANPSAGMHFLRATASGDNDILTISDGQGTLNSAGLYELDFTGFQMMNFISPAGRLGQSQASMSATIPGNDTFQAGPRGGNFLQDRNTYEVQFSGFHQVHIDDTSGGTNLFIGSPIAYQLDISGFTPASQYHPLAGQRLVGVFAKIRAVVLQLDPSLAQITDRLNLAIALRDWVNHRFRLGEGVTAPWVTKDAYTRFLAAIVYRTQSILCQGVQVVFADVLNAFGLAARYVDLFAPDGNNHATTEVAIGGRWLAMDATFDVSFVSPTGRYLNYAQLRLGIPYLVQHNGTQSQPRLNYEGYPVPLGNFLVRITYPPRMG
jgi:hypothetical protein